MRMNKLEVQIKQLEEQLLHADVRANPELLEQLLADDFEEIGSSGMISNRHQVIDWLVTREKAVTWSIQDFRIRQLSPELVLANYRAMKDGQNTRTGSSMRSSLWQLSGKQWKMVFHQGTREQDE